MSLAPESFTSPVSNRVHKSIDLVKSSSAQQTKQIETSPAPALGFERAPTTPQGSLGGGDAFGGMTSSMRKQNSVSSMDNNSRRFSILSKTSFGTSTTSFLFGSSKRAKISGSVPKINLHNIIKKKAYLYLDESLANTFDELLDQGYNMVVNKKHERDEMKEQENYLKNEINEVEKDIIPLINKMFSAKEAIAHQKNLKGKYMGEVQALNTEIDEMRHVIKTRTEEIKENTHELNNKIKDLEMENNDIRNEISQNKAIHKSEKESLENEIKIRKNEQQQLVEKLNDLKRQYEEKKQSQAERLRKMENKSKMYIGILKH